MSHGVLFNKNTIEDFKNCDKMALMNEEGRKIWESITNGSCIENPSLFVRFFALSFAVSTFCIDIIFCSWFPVNRLQNYFKFGSIAMTR